MNLMRLTDEYKITQNKLDELFEQISKIMEIEVEVNGVKCSPIEFDIDDETLTLHPSDGESILSREGKHYVVSFDEFEALLKFYNKKEDNKYD